MSNGADAKRRTDRGDPRGEDFSDAQRIWLLERDFDDFEKRLDERLAKMESTLRRISTACVVIGGSLIASLALLVIQLGAK